MKKLTLIIVCLILSGSLLLAQPVPSEDPIGKAFFSPELVMQNQQAIGLTEAQRNNFSKEMQSAQSEFMTLQWDVQKEMEKFKSLIEKEAPSEAEVLDQLERVVTVENKMKRRQITLMVRVKNLLTHEQQEKLSKLRK